MPQPAARQFSGIFVCYRRDDSSGHAGRLFDKLSDHFGKDRIFMDIDTIEPGEDFVTVIENAVGSCEILIAIIGRHWLSSTGESPGWLDNPNDFVRVEIATALSRDIRVIPVLVQRASMPKPQDLPEDLVKLSRRNAVELSDLRWQNDVEDLIGVMERVLAKREEERRRAEQAEEELLRGEKEQRAENRGQDLRSDETQREQPLEITSAQRTSSSARRAYLVLGAVLLFGILVGIYLYLNRNRSGAALQPDAQWQTPGTPTPPPIQNQNTNDGPTKEAASKLVNVNKAGDNNQNRITVSNNNVRLTNTSEAERQQNANRGLEEKLRQNANRALEEDLRRQRAINALTRTPSVKPTPYRVP